MNEFKNFYATTTHRKFNTWCKRTQRLDTYGCGCAHDCKYCYAKSLLTFRKFWDIKNPKIAYITEIEKKISLLEKNEIIRLGGMTECFQPIELSEGVTFETIKLLNRYRINYLIVTKSDIITFNKYLNIYDKTLAHFQVSITSTSNRLSEKYENSPSTEKRIESIEKLHSLGFDVSIRLSPLIDENINYSKLNKIKCNKILIEFLKANWFIKKTFDIDYTKYSHKYGGYENLELDEKINIVNKIDNFEQVSVGEYVEDHYKYFRDNVNYNKEDCCNVNIAISKQPEQIEMF